LADAACLKQFGKFFDYLRQNDCYDNTRIIIVSDHGWIGGENNIWFDDFENPDSAGAIWFNAMLIVKDFGSTGEVKRDDSFMTNADTLFLAKKDLPVSDTNPFTGKKLVQNKDGGVNIYWCVDWNAANFYDAKQFQLDENLNWHVSKNIYDKKNWIPLADWKKAHGGEK
jgi:arylsulfatase A-like enzyme